MFGGFRKVSDRDEDVNRCGIAVKKMMREILIQRQQNKSLRYTFKGAIMVISPCYKLSRTDL